MVKGISRQVSVLHSPDQKLFEQAIFILKEDAREVTDEMLLKEAKSIIQRPYLGKTSYRLQGATWAMVGAAVTGFAWLLTALL